MPPTLARVESLLRQIFLLALLGTGSVGVALVYSVTFSPQEISTTIDPRALPSFPGGEKAMYAFIAKNLRQPLDLNADATVFVQFIVTAEGFVEDIRIKRGVAQALDEEALRLVSAFPKWLPPERAEAKPSRVLMTLPIRFRQ